MQNIKSIRNAFSLIEMLMALLVASLLLAALAPVMTRKFNENINIGAGNTKSLASYECFPYSDSLGDITYNLTDVHYVNFIIASGGGGGGGSTKEKVEIKDETYKTTGTTSNVTKDIPITNTMTKVIITQLIGGGGGGGHGATYKNTETVAGQTITPSTENCANYGTKYAAGKSDTVGNQGAAFATYDTKALCVTKYNQKVGTNGSNGCYGGYSNVTKLTTSATAYEYSPAGRWACNHSGGEAACTNLAALTGHSWRLPVASEIATWKTKVFWQALMLCDDTSAAYVHRCDQTSTKPDSANHAWPYHIRSKEGNVDYYLQRSKLLKQTKNSSLDQYYSTRCVLDSWKDKDYTKYTYGAYGGGGGGSAGYLANIDITQYVKQAQNSGGGTIRIVAGAGGTGAPVNGNPLAGGNSNIWVYNKNGGVIYAWASDGGKAGGNATSSAAGSGGTTPGCFINNGSSWVSTNCSTNGIKGTNGTAPSRYTGTTTAGYLVASGGNGANSSYSNGTTGGGIGGNAAAGGAGGYYGGGGGGGARSDGSAVVYYAGGNGAGGIAEVKVTYQEEYAGSGGGGGAGGNVAKISNVDVGKNSTCTIHVGAGGYGGSFDTDGTDGVWSWVKCRGEHPDADFYVYGGSGGKKGKTAETPTGKATGGAGGGVYNGGFSDSIKKPAKGLSVYMYTGKAGTSGVEGKAGGGGESGSGSKGGCGGLNKTSSCVYNVSSSIYGSGFTYQNIIVPEFKEIQSKVFGTFGAGGGGGAYDKTLGSGTGGKGMPGYVCLYYYTTNDNDRLKE